MAKVYFDTTLSSSPYLWTPYAVSLQQRIFTKALLEPVEMHCVMLYYTQFRKV